jgi:hypothetical protein
MISNKTVPLVASEEEDRKNELRIQIEKAKATTKELKETMDRQRVTIAKLREKLSVA